MAGNAFALSMLAKPFVVGLGLLLIYGFVYAVWKLLPDGKLKRLLFKSWGRDHGPWVSDRHSRTRRADPASAQERLPHE